MNVGRPNPMRKGAGPIVPPPQGHGPTAQQYAMQQQQERERMARAARLAPKPTDRYISEELSTVTVGDGVDRYTQLRDAERRLDALMTRKRLDIKDSVQRPLSRREGTLRIWISNTADGQPWQENGSGLNEDNLFDFENDNNAATYRVKIEGKLLDTPDNEDKDEDEEAAAAAVPKPKLSSFFKEITVDYHRNPALHPDGFAQISWRKAQRHPANAAEMNSKENLFDSLEFERKGDENINVTVNLVRDQARERYKLSPPLSDLLDTDEEDMPGLVQGIWEYARAMNLQEDDDKRTITCDEPLQRIFNSQKIVFPRLGELLHPHLQPIPPIKLEYTIRVDKAYISPAEGSDVQPSQPSVYDIRVPLPSKIVPVLQKYRANKSHADTLKTIIDMDETLALLVAKINDTNSKRKFYDNLSKDPYTFVNRWVSSQKRDLEVVLAETNRIGSEEGEWRVSSDVWNSTVAKESVGLWLARNGKA